MKVVISLERTVGEMRPNCWTYFLLFTVNSTHGFYSPLGQKWFETGLKRFNVNIVDGNLKSEIMARNLNEIVCS